MSIVEELQTAVFESRQFNGLMYSNKLRFVAKKELLKIKEHVQSWNAIGLQWSSNPFLQTKSKRVIDNCVALLLILDARIAQED